MFNARPALSAFTVAVVAASTLALSACSSSDDPAPVQTVVVTAAPSDAPSPIASALADATADAKEALAEATADAKDSLAEATAEAKEEIETFTMPELVGMNLQDAQDTLQGLGSYLMDQEDASGKDRFQLNDSNWTVCTQDPAAGTEVKITEITTLAAVKLDESC